MPNSEPDGSLPAGVSFELAIAAVQRLVDPGAVVTHNERLKDRLGHWRQFDVVIRGNFAGQAILGVVECKDLKRPVGVPEVNAFADKAANVRAHLKVMASRRGFTKTAFELAEHHGISCISLLAPSQEGPGIVLRLLAFADLVHWGAL
jgi:hypothetical protein